MLDDLAGIDDPHGSCGQIAVDLLALSFPFERVSQDPGRVSLSVDYRRSCEMRSSWSLCREERERLLDT